MRVQELVDSTFAKQPLLRQSLPHKQVMPQVIKPKGLHMKRQWYLYNDICPFTERCQEITTPLLTAAKPRGPDVQATDAQMHIQTMSRAVTTINSKSEKE